MLNISREDLLRSKTVKPGWYPVIITRAGEKPAKTDGSTTWPIDFKITAKGEYQDVPVSTVFSEKAPGFAVKFIEACGGTVGVDGGQFDLTRSAGKVLEIYIENELYDGRLTNKVKDYRRPSAQGSQEAKA